MPRNAMMVAAFLLIMGCTGTASTTDDVPPSELVTVRYCVEPFRTFRIDGTDVTGVSLANLANVLAEHKSAHPSARYEVVAEVKSTPRTQEEIEAEFAKAGISIEHYWVAVSDASGTASPHGPGYVDTKE